MNKTSELKRILGENLSWNKCRIDCFVKMLLALITVRKVNLSEIAIAFASNTEVSSRYKRLQRFFRYMKIDYTEIARWVFKLFIGKKRVYLAMDRTNWFWGKTKINILTLGIVYKGAAIPIIWMLLNKAGNASAKEHKNILQRFVKLFGNDCVAGFLADREFASGYLFGWFNKNKIPFFIRIKDNGIVKIQGKKFLPAKKLFNYLGQKQKSKYAMAVEIYGQKVYLSGSRSERGALMVVASNECQSDAIEVYLLRWQIETLFCCLKSRGFHFESTRLVSLERIEKMMTLLTIGFCWAHKTGEWLATKKPIRYSKHHDGRRPQNSFFRYGLDFIREIILNWAGKITKFRQCLRALDPPKMVINQAVEAIV
jgi:hypothetical protein